jgi:hypothetical protein
MSEPKFRSSGDDGASPSKEISEIGFKEQWKERA